MSCSSSSRTKRSPDGRRPPAARRASATAAVALDVGGDVGPPQRVGEEARRSCAARSGECSDQRCEVGLDLARRSPRGRAAAARRPGARRRAARRRRAIRSPALAVVGAARGRRTAPPTTAPQSSQVEPGQPEVGQPLGHQVLGGVDQPQVVLGQVGLTRAPCGSARCGGRGRTRARPACGSAPRRTGRSALIATGAAEAAQVVVEAGPRLVGDDLVADRLLLGQREGRPRAVAQQRGQRVHGVRRAGPAGTTCASR